MLYLVDENETRVRLQDWEEEAVITALEKVRSEHAEQTGIAVQWTDKELEDNMKKYFASQLPDEEAAKATVLFPKWAPGFVYSAGDRVVYGGALYRVLQSHTAQSDWNPANTPSLFANVLIAKVVDEETGEIEEPAISEWVQPDSTNPYMTGDRVMYQGELYESVIDNNIWAPSEYPAGWQKVE